MCCWTGRGRGTTSTHPPKASDSQEDMLTKLELGAIEGCLLRQREGDEESSGRIKVGSTINYHCDHKQRA